MKPTLELGLNFIIIVIDGHNEMFPYKNEDQRQRLLTVLGTDNPLPLLGIMDIYSSIGGSCKLITVQNIKKEPVTICLSHANSDLFADLAHSINDFYNIAPTNVTSIKEQRETLERLFKLSE